MSVSSPASSQATGFIRAQTIAVNPMGSSAPSTNRLYRLVDQQGEPHPVLDDLYESLDAAWADAQGWWRDHVAADHSPVGIGVEVSTASGGWRTLRHPGV